MMNTKVYKAVHTLAEKLMTAAHKDDSDTFYSLYAELEAICSEHENTEKDHPIQWETLADFTEELADALVIYEKALQMSIAIDSKDHISSIGYSMASMQIELGQKDAAIKNLKAAKVSAQNIEDDELRAEIDELLETLI